MIDFILTLCQIYLFFLMNVIYGCYINNIFHVFYVNYQLYFLFFVKTAMLSLFTRVDPMKDKNFINALYLARVSDFPRVWI